MKLIVQPDEGIAPILLAIKKARKRLDLAIFRFDRRDLEKALAAAVARGVAVRALIAHTNRGGEKGLRKLEMRLLEAGVSVARTADDLPRYHGKMIIADETLYLLAFNFTRLDMERSRSFGVITRNRSLVLEAARLFEADLTRQPYSPGFDRLVVSPENARPGLAAFLKGARRQLLIYDTKISDPLMIKILLERAKAGVEVRILGKLAKAGGELRARPLSGLRLHTRAMIRDGRHVFVGSQSLRKLELDGRREIGVIVNDARIVKGMLEVFESDWSAAKPDKDEAKERKAS